MKDVETVAPSALGRGVVIASGAVTPDPWQDAPRIVVDAKTLLAPQKTVERLHHAWAFRTPVVVELGVSKEELQAPQSCHKDPYELTPAFEFERERLHFLVWANNYDATKGDPIWWHGRLAQRLGAKAHPLAEVDLDGPVWCDGGPRTDLPFAVLHRETIEQGRLLLTHPLRQQTADFLDSEQLHAVTATAPSLRVLAPAGSGKTRVLTARFRHLLEHGYEPTRICALAYNKRAAQEMLGRLAQAGSSVRTLHSLGFSLLRRFRPGLQMAKPGQIRQILHGLVKVGAQANTDPLAPYLEALQAVRLALVSPEEVEKERDDVPGFAALFPRYRKRLAEAQAIDYDEQIYGCLELLLENPEARKWGRRLCTHLLVDEFQDLTPAFVLMIRLLASPTYQVFGVGDDDQVIYGYAGASPDFLVNYTRYFPSAESRLLKNNYRCPSGVVAAANQLLSRNKNRIRKEAAWAGDTESYPQLLPTEQQQWAERGVVQIQEWLGEYEPEQIAVLSRVNSLLMPLQVALSRSRIPHTKVVDEQILERTGLRSALAYWRLCHGNWNSQDLSDALRRPNRMLKKEILERASHCRDRTELQRYALKQESWPMSQLEEFLGDLARLARRAEKGPAAFFAALRSETEFTSALDTLDAGGLGAAGSSHRDDLLALESLAAQCGEPDFEGWLRDWLNQSDSQEQGIRLSSVHRVKGLEWPCVLIYGGDEGLFPHRLADDIEEERRVFHVALTRCSKQCVLMSSSGQVTRFVREMIEPLEPPKGKKRKKKR